MTDPVFALEPDVPRNVRLARWLLFRLLSGLREGSLTVREGAQTFHFGDPAAALRAEVRVCAPEVYWRLLTGGSWRRPRLDGRRLGEPPADGAASDPRAQRRGAGASGARLPSAGQARRPAAPLDPPQHPRQARENIAAHYDLGNEFYAYFLDDDLLYSSALFTDDQQDLTCAQRAKMARLCDQLALTPGDHLLEIGTGWGRWPSTPPAITAAGSPPPPFPGSSTAGLPSAWPAPGCRIASKCCSATTAICAASTTNWCRWR